MRPIGGLSATKTARTSSASTSSVQSRRTRSFVAWFPWAPGTTRCKRRPSAARFVEHFWSVSWDLREQVPFDSTVITFPSLHLTHEWGDDGPRHGFPLPNTLVHGV